MRKNVAKYFLFCIIFMYIVYAIYLAVGCPGNGADRIHADNNCSVMF